MSTNQKKKIVITGASGFLGKHLVDRLVRDHRFDIFALSSKGDELQKNNTDKRLIYCDKDVFQTDSSMLTDAVIVNCAFPRNSTGTGMADGLHYIQKLFECAVDCQADAIINISSQSVYSAQREEVAAEETPICLDSPYAVGKYAIELMLESICRKSKTKFTNLRMASLIGPGFDQRIVNRLIKQAFRGETLRIVKSEQRFGFLDVQDAVTAVYSLLNEEIAEWNHIYNVGNGKSYRISDIADCIMRVFHQRGLDFPQMDIEAGSGSGNTGVAYSLLMNDTGYKPTVDLNTSVQMILDHEQKICNQK